MSSTFPETPEWAREVANPSPAPTSSEMVCDCGRCLIMDFPDQPVVPMRRATPEEVHRVSPTCALHRPRVISLVTQTVVLGPVQNSRFLNNRQRMQSGQESVAQDGERGARRRRIERMRERLPFLLDISLLPTREGASEGGNANRLHLQDVPVPLAPHPSMLSPPPFPHLDDDTEVNFVVGPVGFPAGGFDDTVVRTEETTCGSMPASSSSAAMDSWSSFGVEEERDEE
uniref:Uncharacterized protein n=1 Tax=Chromera velia CCMP2878 TaxID=1169474 RepID=A0A0G4FPB9_9ALVE|eukprot:Cvel_18074.t1-p1 / transcript=Cvel_18074.t1 / gene=Cvel_18074 / organism=Chromera_velia_CCMP2878 / gene_product=hypothetical protein / transcript_product=hypothetical protein / location=Cvel_scaffold1478:21479-22723(-) / protein_length=228 / sequence_SO=supercontig / SO=protein_coding / is_pseudo=false